MLLSLQRRHHVLRIHLNAPDPVMQRMFIPLDEEFPLLDHLSIITHSPVAFTEVTLPNSLRAPKLRNLFLDNVDLQIGTPILTTSLRLVSLTLWGIPTSTHTPPEYLADLLVLMPQLRAVSLRFRGSSHSPIPRSGVSTHPPLALEVPKMFFTLRCLERLWFTGYNTYLEGILARIIAPVLSKFEVYFFDQRSSERSDILPNLSRFLDATTELSFRVALINFQNKPCHYRKWRHRIASRVDRRKAFFLSKRLGRTVFLEHCFCVTNV